ncbi:MAG TPA: DUF6265 family protein [Burkholderiaceae bacterium]|nr:DUF6265 family protein [Burkholderiaceae bacterium]
MRAALASLLVLLTAPAAATSTTEQLHWLAGCWAAVGGEPGSGEQWMAPAGGSMLGTSRTLRRGALREFEFLHIRDTAQGLVLVALPSGQKEAQFAAEKVEARGVVFHNPGHDFPQRVIYESPDADTLDARIEGQRNGQLRVIRFPMKRAPCPLGAASGGKP